MRLVLKTILLFFLLPYLALALSSDEKEKIHVQSDSTVYNYKTGENVFMGNVIVDQGTTHIIADKLTTKSNITTHKIQEAIAYGITKSAHYWTLPKVGDQEIHAYANIIKFYPQESNTILQENVTITQGENTFSGQLILYNRNQQTITVPASKHARAVLVYNPDQTK